MKKIYIILVCMISCISANYAQTKANPMHEILEDDVNVYADQVSKIIKVVYFTSFKSDVYLKVTNERGETIYASKEPESRGEHNKLIDLGQYPNGVYVVTVESESLKQEDMIFFN